MDVRDISNTLWQYVVFRTQTGVNNDVILLSSSCVSYDQGQKENYIFSD